MFTEYAEGFHNSLTGFIPYGTVQGHAFRGITLSPELRLQLISNGEHYLGFTYSALPMTKYMSFVRNGNRSDYEKDYFAKRTALCSLVLAEAVEDKERFLDDIVNGIFAICEESAWQLPAHNSYVRDTPCELLPDNSSPILDLFACETGALLSCVLYILGDSLDSLHPFIKKRIMTELEYRIITPYLTKHFWWMGRGDEPMCNWTVWCTQNILLTAFMTDQTAKCRKEVFDKALRSIDFFLKDYGEDGCCEEGAQYYRHAGLCLFNTIEILNGVTQDFFKSLYNEPKIKHIAEYILNVHVDDKYYFNFADCSPVAGRAGVREFLFGIRIGSQTMMQFAAEDFGAAQDKLLTSEINLFYRMQNILTYTQITEFKVENVALPHDIYYNSVGLAITRDSIFSAAVKTGDNADSHNHNDTGSITVYKHAKPLLIDVGVATYTRQTFSAERYSLWPMQSAYHNLPTINGCMQLPGSEYRAKDILINGLPPAKQDASYTEKEKITDISFDIAAAYPPEANITSYRRHVSFTHDKSIEITDVYSGSCDIKKDTAFCVQSLMTYEKPVLDGNILHIGDLADIQLSGFGDIQIEEIPISDDRLKTAWEHSIYRILLAMESNMTILTIM